MRVSGKWRLYRPRLRGRLNDPVAYQPDSLYAQARLIAQDALRSSRVRIRRDDIYKRTARAVKYLRQHDAHDAAHLLALLLLQTPVAVRAQIEMDAHRGGYKNRQARLFELIDFNDTIVSTVLALSNSELVDFEEVLPRELKTFCDQLGVASFTDQQIDAIIHGLSREIAVYRGAKRLGYLVRMTSRVQDAKGIDMVVTDPETKKSINIDVKTRSAFHFRLLDLQRQNRLDEQKRLRCELAGFCTIKRPQRELTPTTVLFRVSTELFGPIKHFDFVDLNAFEQSLANAMQDHGRYII